MMPMNDAGMSNAKMPADGQMTCPKCGAMMTLTAEPSEPAGPEAPEAEPTAAPDPGSAKSFQDPKLKWE
jgi:hypothetical protein